jgi:hypothetical protein
VLFPGILRGDRDVERGYPRRGAKSCCSTRNGAADRLQRRRHCSFPNDRRQSASPSSTTPAAKAVTVTFPFHTPFVNPDPDTLVGVTGTDVDPLEAASVITTVSKFVIVALFHVLRRVWKPRRAPLRI